jgi:hypothetical protein
MTDLCALLAHADEAIAALALALLAWGAAFRLAGPAVVLLRFLTRIEPYHGAHRACRGQGAMHGHPDFLGLHERTGPVNTAPRSARGRRPAGVTVTRPSAEGGSGRW